MYQILRLIFKELHIVIAEWDEWEQIYIAYDHLMIQTWF
jgi:hypothetical protein